MMISLGELTLSETFGLSPAKVRWEQTRLALGGDDFTPRSQWGLSSVGIFTPSLSIKTWLGHRPADRLVPISNFFNRTQTPPEEGWSVKKTQVQDFRGGTRTYDSHNGTDFAIPVSTIAVAPAPGIVMRVSSEFHRGGLKVVIDHGRGLITTMNHLGRALVCPGDLVRRGQPVAITAYSGIDAVVGFPWSVPHIHFNTWFLGEYVDPFAIEGEVSLWREHNDPKPAPQMEDSPVDVTPGPFDHQAVLDVIDSCKDKDLAATLRGQEHEDRRAVDVIFMRNYFPTRFESDQNVYAESFEREPVLDLMFRAQDYDGVRFLA